MPGFGKSGTWRILAFRWSMSCRVLGRRATCAVSADEESQVAARSAASNRPRRARRERATVRAGVPLRDASSDSSSPSATASTRPSGRLRTTPVSPSRRAMSWVKYRNPTPCTRPLTRNRRATRISALYRARGRLPGLRPTPRPAGPSARGKIALLCIPISKKPSPSTRPSSRKAARPSSATTGPSSSPTSSCSRKFRRPTTRRNSGRSAPATCCCAACPASARRSSA